MATLTITTVDPEQKRQLKIAALMAGTSVSEAIKAKIPDIIRELTTPDIIRELTDKEGS